MKFKEFVIDSIKKEFLKNETQPLTDVDALIKYVCSHFSEQSMLDEEMLVSDENAEIELFHQKLMRTTNRNEREQMVISFARFLDNMSTLNKYWYVIPYDKFYISSDNKILFNWLDADTYCISDQKKIPDSVRNEYYDLMSAKLNSMFISQQLLNQELTKNAFYLYLLKTDIQNLPSPALISIKKIFKVMMSFFKLKPEEKYAIHEISYDLKKFQSCNDIAAFYFNSKKKSICEKKQVTDNVWEYAFHTEHGRNKKSLQNEDAYTLVRSENCQSMLFMLADGVSTANIGSGKLASIKILNYIEDRKDEILQFMSSISHFDSEDWINECKKKLTEIIRNINEESIADLNKRVLNRQLTDVHPMCSTLILGFTDKNRVLFAYLGDSQVYYVKGDKIMRINEDHNVLEERIANYFQTTDRKIFTEDASDKHLTKVIPMSEYDQSTNQFNSNIKDEDISFFNYYPEENSYLFVCTDGLMDSIKTGDDDVENERELLKLFKELMQKHNFNLKEVSRQICRMADEKAGVDNMTLLILTNTKAKKENQEFKKINNQR
ncbi:MAG: protein phosphatase 2C domain-containing protein [Candidatus Cloacimonetes bacterium]|nr:protein phosphatase 2C domain-containing protein [Candidatus Cloacimonadota bacterium]